MKQVSLWLLSLCLCCSLYAQKANYAQAAKFSPKRLEKMLFTLNADIHWLKGSDKFWYMYETSEGKQWYFVDAAKAEKKLLFDNDKLAAQITRIIKDPFDAQHLGLDSIRFISDNILQFEVKSSIEIEKKDSTAKKDAKPVKEKKIFYFEYNITTGQLTELVGFKKPKRKPQWASVSPGGNLIVFGKKNNLYYMDKANYEKALQNEDDSTIVETQLTFDGEENYSYHGTGSLSGNGETNVDKEKNKNKRKAAFIYWSSDNNHFATIRTDNRKVKDLWVINSIADPRPTLETYKYWMPGEKEAPVDELLIFDVAAKSSRR